MAPPTYQQLAELRPADGGSAETADRLEQGGEQGYDTYEFPSEHARQAKSDRIKLMVIASLLMVLVIVVSWIFLDPHDNRSRARGYAEIYAPPGYKDNPLGFVQTIPKSRSLEKWRIRSPPPAPP
jgi:hypothetical protein